MATLAAWLREQLARRNLTKQAATVHVGVSGATLSHTLNRDHVLRRDILFRLADYFDTPCEDLLRLAARMPAGGDLSRLRRLPRRRPPPRIPRRPAIASACVPGSAASSGPSTRHRPLAPPLTVQDGYYA